MNKAKNKIILALILGMFLISLCSASVKYTPDSKTSCSNGICTSEIYSEIRFINEDKVWKPIEEAKSLKNSGIKLEVIYGKDAGDPKSLIISDFNYTTIILKDVDTASLSIGNKELPIKIYADNVLKNEKRINLAGKTKTDLKLSWTLGDEIHFGESSTIIKIINNSIGGILADSYVRNNSKTTNYGTGTDIYIGYNTSFYDKSRAYVMFNLSIIPLGSSLLEGNFSMYASSSGSPTLINGSVYHVFQNTTWTETGITWNNQPCGNGTDLDTSKCANITALKPLSSTRNNWNITDSLKYLTQNNTNISFMIDSPEFQGYRGFISKESGLSQKPYLTLVYNYSDSIAPAISIISPINESISTSSLVLLNISASDDVALDSVWYSINLGATNITYSSPVNLSLSNANYTLYSWANDSVGNVNFTSISFAVQNFNPEPNCSPATQTGVGLVILLTALTIPCVCLIFIWKKDEGIDLNMGNIFLMFITITISLTFYILIAQQSGGIC